MASTGILWFVTINEEKSLSLRFVTELFIVLFMTTSYQFGTKPSSMTRGRVGRAKAYLRYGDDFVMFEMDEKKLRNMRTKTMQFLQDELKLCLHPTNDVIVKAKHGLKFLSVEIWARGRRLSKCNRNRIVDHLNLRNISSYHGVMSKHEGEKIQKLFDWQVQELLNLSE